MGSLLEAVAAIAISAAVMTTMTAALGASVRIEAACAALGGEMFEARQLEHLVDRAVLVAGAGPDHPAAVSSLTGDTVAFAADSNGDGKVDSTSSETTALEVRQSGRQARVRVRLGRQTMTVVEADDAEAVLVALDHSGRPADAASATLVDLAIVAKDARPDDAAKRRLLFALPSRAGP